MTVRVGVIGLGVMGRHHARILSDMDGVTLVGVADVNAAVLSRVTRGRDLRGFIDFAELLAAGRPDFVVVAVPTGLHHHVSLAAMESGVDLLIEKPIASNCVEALELIHAETSILDPIVGVTEGRMVRFKVEPKEPLRAELEDVVAAIRDGRPPLVGPDDAYAALEIAETIVASGRTGRVITMPRRVAASA